MPKLLIYLALIGFVLAMIPPAIIAWMRTNNSAKPRIHIVQNMDNQPRFKSQMINPLFADRRAMRRPVPGAVARGELHEDRHLHQGVVTDAWATTFPASIPVTMNLMRRGEERFNIYCQPCHGLDGYGDGMVHQRAMELIANPSLGNGTSWVPPKSLHDAEVRDQPVGQIFNSITNGVRNMAGYEAQIPLHDRWAIVAYVRALQRSQNARPNDLPAATINALDTIILYEEPQEPTPDQAADQDHDEQADNE